MCTKNLAILALSNNQTRATRETGRKAQKDRIVVGFINLIDTSSFVNLTGTLNRSNRVQLLRLQVNDDGNINIGTTHTLSDSDTTCRLRLEIRKLRHKPLRVAGEH